MLSESSSNIGSGPNRGSFRDPLLDGDRGLAPVGFLIAGLGVVGSRLDGSPGTSLVPLTLPPSLLGVGLATCRGPPIMLFEKFGLPTPEGRVDGVDPGCTVFR